MLTRADTNEDFEAVINQSLADGYLVEEEAMMIQSDLAGDQLNALGRVQIKLEILRRATRSAYHQNDPTLINEWMAGLKAQEKQMLEEGQQAFYRSPFIVGEPKSTTEQLEKQFSKVLSKVRKRNPVNVVQSISDLPITVPANVGGMYHQGEVYIVADNTSKLEFEETLAHELVGHLGLEEMLGPVQFKSLLISVHNLRNKSPRIRKVLDNIRTAYTNEQGAYALDDIQEAREILAHISQETPNYLTDGAVTRVYENIKRAVKRFLSNFGFYNKTDLQLDQLIYDAAMFTRNGYHANRKGRTFLRFGSEAQALMQRAWDLGYRGLDFEGASNYLKQVHNGDEVVAKRSVDDILNADTKDSFLDEAAFSRKPINRDAVDANWREFIPEQENPKSKFIRAREALQGGFIRDAVNRFRVGMVDTVSVLEDKIMNKYNNALVSADGMLNPMVSYVQALKHDAIAHGFMRSGHLRLREDGLWDTSQPKGAKKQPSLVDVYQKIGELGKKIGSVETASNAASKVFVARREVELYEQNEDIEARALKLENEGKTKQAEALRATKKDIFFIQDGGVSRPMNDAELQARMAENRRIIKEKWDTTPELREAYELFNEFRSNMLQVASDTGFISKDKMAEWLDNAAYVPFYRVKEGLDENDMRRGGSGMMNIETMKQLRGSTKDVGNALDNMAELAMWMTASIVKNHGSRELARGLRETGGIRAEYKSDKEAPRDAQLVTYYDKGVKKFIEPIDPLDAKAWQGMESAALPGLKMLGTGAEWLRKGITLTPDFILSQLEQDSFRAYGFSGVKNPFKAAMNVIPSFIKIRTDLQKGELGNAELNKLGILGMYDISPEHTREQVELPIKGDNLTGFQRMIRWGERNAEASDLAQRLAIYEQTLAEGGSEIEAFWRASEIINFSRRGNSTIATAMRQVVPFQNAYAQGMNILGKTLSGRGLSQLEKKQAFLVFARAGMKIAMLSTLYAMMMADDDDYANQPHHLRSRYFMMPSPFGDGFLKLAMPPDLAFLFKHIPETIVMASMRTDGDWEKRARETQAAFLHAVMGPNVMPQLIKPTAEAFFNYSFFTGAPIVGLGEEQLDTDKQYRENTSLLARAFGEIGISPLKADHVLRGTFGTIGGYGLLATDLIGEQVFDIERTDRELADYPIAKTVFTRAQGTAYKADFYQLRRDVRQKVTTMNMLEREGRVDELRDFMSDEDNRTLLKLKDSVNAIDNIIKKSNQAIKRIQASDMSGADKRELIDAERKRIARLSGEIARLRQYREQ